jgi:hypothetical protein
MSRSWAVISNYSIYSATAVFALSFLVHAIETAWAVKVPAAGKSVLDYARNSRAARIATALMILGFLLLLVGVVARGISASRAPWGNMYEFSITGALAFSGAYLAALRKYDLRKLQDLARSKGIKITKKKNGKTVYISKDSIINKLCEHKHGR